MSFTAVPASAECGCWRFVRPEGRPPGAVLTEITAPTETAAWAVGVRAEAPYVLAWNGSRFREIQVPVPAGTALEGISAASASDVWVVGTAKGGTGHTAHWTGRAWRGGTLRGAVLRAVEARTPSEVWAAGGRGGTGAIWRWNGHKWAPVPLRDRVEELTSLSARAAGDAWAVGGRASVLHWDGRAWTRVRGPQLPAGATLTDIAAPRPGEAWTVGTTPSGGALVLRWGGKSWTSLPAPGARLHSITGDGRAGVWVGGEDAVGRPLLAHWAGARWAVSRPPVPGGGRGTVWALAHVPGSSTLRAAGSHSPLSTPQPITWTNTPRPR
ncbi:hypothetical protein [Spirillospora sp. CA-294931]|uniref:hypothetical protein n=1 Tax=Spirillospora sp. CA-294931 TaxID=3240042 RepID=UPI003D91AEBB